MADARGAQLGGFQHTFGAVGLGRMQRDAQAGIAHQAQGTCVLAGWMAELGTGQVKRHHALAAVFQGQARGAFGFFGRLMAHAAHNQTAGQFAALQAGQQGLDHGFAGHAVGFKQQRCDAEFSQHHAVVQGIFGGLEGHTFHRVGAGHGGHGEGKTFEILLQAAGMCIGLEPGRQAGLGVRRRRQATLLQQRQQGGHTQAAVQVFVQQHFGQQVGPCQGREGGHGGVKGRLGRRICGCSGGGSRHRRMLPGADVATDVGTDVVTDVGTDARVDAPRCC